MMQKPDKFLPALYGGLIMGFVSAVPFLNFINCLCCAGILLGGFLSVFFYKSNFPDTPSFTAGDCLAVGAMAGVVGAIVGTLLSLAFVVMFGDVMKEFILRFLENAQLEIPEEALQEIRRAIEESETGVLSVFFDFLFALLIYPIFGLLGGLIGYGVWKPKPPVMQAPPPAIGA